MNLKLLLFFALFRFTSVIHAHQTNKDSIPKSYELKQPQYKIWDSIYNIWMTKEYPKILKQNKLKMNCHGCESVAMNAVFIIDETGKLKNYKVIKSKVCGKEFSKKLELQFINRFQNQPYPPELFNLKFEVHLGSGLKC